MVSLLETFASNPQYRQPGVVLLTFTLAVLLNWLYKSIAEGKKKKREYVYANVPPGLDGYKKGQMQYLTQCTAVIQEGIRKFGESTVFWVPSMLGPMMVAPLKYLDEIKNHPDLSFAQYLYDGFGGAQTHVDAPFRSQNFMTVIKQNITQSLAHVTAALSEETALAMDDKLPITDEWTSYKLHPTLQLMVARVSSRVFLGDTLCRDQRWLYITLSFARNMVAAGIGLRTAGRFLAPIAKWWLPSCGVLTKTIRDADALIMAVVKERRQEEKAQGDAYVKPSDALQWAIDIGEPDSELANFQLFFSFVAIHTTSSTMTQMVYDLCQYPEYVEILREELREVLGGVNFNAASEVHKLRKMDSFMKESQRLHPIVDAILQRQATKDIDFSDGLKVYAGDRLQVFCRSALRDPRIYNDPDSFDGLRFYKMRQQTGQENRHQFVSSTDNFFVFGCGSHVCPGRFFASNEIKIILSHLLMKYDFRFLDGQTDRPADLCFEEMISPNPEQEILFRRRRY